MMRRSLYTDVYDDLLARLNRNPDRMAREDALMTIIMDIDDGKDPYDSFATAFDLVHGETITKVMFDSSVALCQGMKGAVIE